MDRRVMHHVFQLKEKKMHTHVKALLGTNLLSSYKRPIKYSYGSSSTIDSKADTHSSGQLLLKDKFSFPYVWPWPTRSFNLKLILSDSSKLQLCLLLQ